MQSMLLERRKTKMEKNLEELMKLGAADFWRKKIKVGNQLSYKLLHMIFIDFFISISKHKNTFMTSLQVIISPTQTKIIQLFWWC